MTKNKTLFTLLFGLIPENIEITPIIITLVLSIPCILYWNRKPVEKDTIIENAENAEKKIIESDLRDLPINEVTIPTNNNFEFGFQPFVDNNLKLFKSIVQGDSGLCPIIDPAVLLKIQEHLDSQFWTIFARGHMKEYYEISKLIRYRVNFLENALQFYNIDNKKPSEINSNVNETITSKGSEINTSSNEQSEVSNLSESEMTPIEPSETITSYSEEELDVLLNSDNLFAQIDAFYTITINRQPLNNLQILDLNTWYDDVIESVKNINDPELINIMLKILEYISQ